MQPFRVLFELDGAGVYYDPMEPIMLDSLLAYCLARFHVHGEPPTRDEEPFDIPLPLQWGDVNGHRVWRASALSPIGPTAETVGYWRRRFRQNRADLTTGSPNLTQATYREWNMPLPLLLCRQMEAFAVGNRAEVQRILRRDLKYLGKKSAHGHGRIVSITCEWCEDDFSWTRQGRAMRWLPTESGTRTVRPRPPYWNNCGKTQCCEIGDAWQSVETVDIVPET